MSDRAIEVLDGPSPRDLADIANREHVLFRQSGEAMVEHAIKAGTALEAVKSLLRHGEWLPWLAGNFEGSEDMAERYMRVAANSARVRNLGEPSLRKALTAISGKEPMAREPRISSPFPTTSFWRELLTIREAIRQLAVVDPSVLAAAVPARRRRQFAKDLREVGRTLGGVASHLEDME